MNLSEFYDYKNKFMEDIITDEKIIKLIDSEATLENATDLIYTSIFPYEFLPETAQSGKTIVMIDIEVYEAPSKTFLTPTIYVWVFSHKSVMRLPEGGVRVDALCSEICEKINGSMFYGLGQLELFASQRFAPMSDFFGKCMTFRATEFNRLFDGKKAIPGNRKLGI